MSYTVIVEMPKDDTRRRHLAYDKSEIIDLGSLEDKIPLNGGRMPVHYGYIPNTDNTAEGDDVDVLFISDKPTEVGGEYSIIPVALLYREDGDHKVVAVEPGNKLEWEDLPEEQKSLLLDYFGYNSEITKIENTNKAQEYIERATNLKPDIADPYTKK